MQREFSLHGTWGFRLDDHKIGLEEEWQNMDLKDRIQIPGILQNQGYGNEINETTPWVSSLYDILWYQREEYKTNLKETQVPFLCQPKRHYIGQAWYRKSFAIPGNLKNHVFYFFIECVKWKTSVWLDGAYIGSETLLCAPHEYYLGELEEGEHTIIVCVDNSYQYPYRPDGHMLSDALGAAWNGMVGKVAIRSVPYIHIERIRAFPDIETKKVRAEVTVRNHRKESRNIRLVIGDTSVITVAGYGCITVNLNLSYPREAGLWDEFSVKLHRLQAMLEFDGMKEKKAIIFGFRRIEVKDGLFYVNHRTTYFRGTHSGGDFPLTGYPSTSVEEWRKIIQTCKSYGLNYIRFHSFCPPEAAFAAADEEGMYLQVECGMWNDFYDGCVMSEILWKETMKILDAFGNHPSFVMLSPSNEPSYKWYKPLTDWVLKCREQDSRRLYTAQSGWPYPMKPGEIENTDYLYFHRSGYGIQPGGTIRNSKGWNGKDYRLSLEGVKLPVVSHEMGQWCSYPDFDVIDKFTGYLQPGNYKVYRENARKRGVLEQNKEFAYLSGQLKVQLYKEEIEANFRTPHIYGFELLDLHDYIGQGTALVGFLDPFWEDKGIISRNKFREFCSETVPLLRIAKRVYTTEETLDCPVEICHFGREELRDAVPYWKVVNEEGIAVRKGNFISRTIPLGKNIEIGRLTIPLSNLQVPVAYTIEIGIRDTTIRNTWSIWVYEGKEYKESHVKILYTRSLKEALEALKLGKRVIYSPLPEHHRLDSPPLQSKAVFWNAQMGPTYGRGMGFVCQNHHPALAEFPSRAYQEWQWDEILHGAYGLNLSEMPKELIPIVQPIDDWNRNYRLGMILECMVGKGSLLIVTADLDQRLSERPAARQLKKSLFDYTASDQFKPKIRVTEDMLCNSFFPRLVMLHYGVKVKVVSQGGKLYDYAEESREMKFYNSGQETENQGREEFLALLDGDPDTFYTSEQLRYPFTIELEAEKEATIRGMLYMPRQNDRMHSGDIKGCKVEALVNGIWRMVFYGELVSSLDPKTILFSEIVTTNKIQFTGLYGFSGEGIPIWYTDKDGWYQKTIDYKDTVAAIGDLLFIPAAVELESITSNFVKTSFYDRAHKKVLEKSVTKEIDY